MLRVISDTAVVISVESQVENPASAASARACCRAATTSAAESIATLTSRRLDSLGDSPRFLDGAARLMPVSSIKISPTTFESTATVPGTTPRQNCFC
jgi:hypothetical protein